MERQMVDYLPPVFLQYPEFRALMAVYQTVFSQFWALEEGAEADMFLASAQLDGLAHWEAIFRITPEAGEMLEERRKRVFARLGQITPYSWPAFLQFLTALTGDEHAVTATRTGLELELRIAPAWRRYYEAVLALTRQMVPANISTRVILVYNPHENFRKLTHGELGQYSHFQLKSEVDRF